MRLGISSYTYSWSVGVPGHEPAHPLTPAQLLGKAAALDVHVVQIVDNLPPHRLSSTELDALAAEAGRLQIDIEVGTRGIAPDHLRTYLEIARRLHSPIVRTITDTAHHEPGEDEVVETLGALMPEFEQAGVCLALENHDRFPVRTLDRILRRIGSEAVGICLDTTNSFGALEGTAAVVEVLGPWTVNLHVKDFVVERASHMLGFVVEGRPAGQGQLDVPWLLESLRAYGRDPNAILELWTAPEETLEATLIKEERWAVESVEYLRRLLPES